MPRLRALALATLTVLSPAAMADTMQVASGGAGQVLIYPYYTVRNGTISLLSVVNTTGDPKAVRLRARESVAGRMVAELNVYLSPGDVWTAAIVASGEGAGIVTSDRSCTLPKLTAGGAPLAFSPLGFAADIPAYANGYTALDRTREGYIELLEMATAATFGALGKDVAHVSGTPACRLTSTVDDPVVVASLLPPSGGLTGSMSFINLNDGVGVSYNATAIDNFWSTAPGKPAVALTAPQLASTQNPRSEPDLASGGNTMVSVQHQGATYISTFARSIDAVSALFMANRISTEYGYTGDGTFANSLVLSMPTKPYYVHTNDAGPFENVYVPGNAQACSAFNRYSQDREEFVAVDVDIGVPPPNQPPPLQTCDVANAIVPLGSRGTAFSSPRSSNVQTLQNAGVSVPVPGKEGGHLTIFPTFPSAFLKPTRTTVLTRSKTTGELESANVSVAYFGLPVIGYMLSVSKYNAGTPQQNFGNLNPVTYSRAFNTVTN